MSAPIQPRHVLHRAFPGIQDTEAAELIAASRTCTFKQGDVICHEGALEFTFYILLEGDVRVTKWVNAREERVLKLLHAGDFFGEMAIIHNAPRAATVTAMTSCSSLELHKDDFSRLLEHSKSMSLAIVREVSRRLRENDEMAIGDLRLKARELAQAYQQLAELEFARREFLTSIAHELRTPLMAANGFMQVIRLGMLEGETLRVALEAIDRSFQEITNLTNDLLFLQEMELILPEFKPVDLGALLAAVIKKQQMHALQNKITLLLDVAPELPPLPGDSQSLNRAFSALLDNAIKFSPNGGEVSVNIGFDTSSIWVRFQDHGVGIPPEALPRIFDRFFHIDSMGAYLFRGLGLGLSIARQVIEQHSGRIEVESTPWRGSTFTVRITRLV